MSGRAKKKFHAPGSVVGRGEYLSVTSPKKKFLGGNKRSSPPSPDEKVDSRKFGDASTTKRTTRNSQKAAASTLNPEAKPFGAKTPTTSWEGAHLAQKWADAAVASATYQAVIRGEPIPIPVKASVETEKLDPTPAEAAATAARSSKPIDEAAGPSSDVGKPTPTVLQKDVSVGDETVAEATASPPAGDQSTKTADSKSSDEKDSSEAGCDSKSKAVPSSDTEGVSSVPNTSDNSPSAPAVQGTTKVHFNPDGDEVNSLVAEDNDDDLWEDVEDEEELASPRALFDESAEEMEASEPEESSPSNTTNSDEEKADVKAGDLYDGCILASTELYPDLEEVIGKIKFVWNEEHRYKLASYEDLSAKEMKKILSAREQATSGNKAKLIRRLEGGDWRRLAVLRELNYIPKPSSSSEEDVANIMSKSNPRRVSTDSVQPASNNGACQSDTSPPADEEMKDTAPTEEVMVESEVEMDTSAVASTEQIGTRKQPSAPTTAAQPVVTPAKPSSRLVLSSGRMLNTRPRRNGAIDGDANFLTVSTPPITNGKQDPAKHAHMLLSKTLSAMKKVDSGIAWYPLWDAEPGEEAIPPLTDPKKFPADLESLQSWVKVTNPWDNRVVKPGETDRNGHEKKQKGLYITILVGSRYSLDHILEMIQPSLQAQNCWVKRKEVDTLDSYSVKSFVGIPNEWDEVSFTALLQNELEKHEEWMQANVRHGFCARKYSGVVFPDITVRRTQIRLPQGNDILSNEESECIQYAWSLRKLLTLEVASCDKHRVLGVLTDFHARGKCRVFSADCDLLDLGITSNAKDKSRAAWYKELFA